MKTTSIDIRPSLSQQQFQTEYLLPQKPVVIKGLVDKSPAGKKWTMDYIKQVCGSVMVEVFDNANPNEASAFTQADLKMSFEKYIDTILKNESTTWRMFLFNMFKLKPELRKDFPCPDLMKGILGRMGYMFFGAKGIKVRIHQDMDMSNVMLTQFHGRKRVLLIHPKYSALLYKLPFNTHSLVDLDQPELKKYPALQYLQCHECILEPGDSLFMPAGYWHYITYLDAGFSVSYRKLANTWTLRWQGLLSLFVYMPFDKLMNKLLGKRWLMEKESIAQNRANKVIQKIHKDYENSIPMHWQLH